MKRFNLSMVCIFAILGGCTSETSSDLLKTQAIQADFKVSSNGQRTKVVAELNVGDTFGSNVELSEGDKLLVEVNGKRSALTKDTDFLDIDYEGRFSDTQDNTLFGISLLRKSEKEAKASVTLPANFSILTPVSTDKILYNQDITIELDTIDKLSSTELVLHYSCDNTNGGTVSGSYATSLNDATSFFNLHTLNLIDAALLIDLKNCNLDVVINRYRIGDISENFANFSQIKGEQTRAVKNIDFTF